MYSPTLSEYHTPWEETSSDIPRIICAIVDPHKSNDPSLRSSSPKCRAADVQIDESELEKVMSEEVIGLAVSKDLDLFPIRRQEQLVSRRGSRTLHFDETDSILDASSCDDSNVENWAVEQSSRKGELTPSLNHWDAFSVADNEIDNDDDQRPARAHRENQVTEIQLNIQASVLAEIAKEAIQEHYNKEPQRRWSKSKHRECDVAREPSPKFLNDNELPETIDRELEVHIGIIKKLQHSLDENDFEDPFNGDWERHALDPDSKREVTFDVLCMVRRSFRLLLTRFARVYRPTGTSISKREIRTVLQQQLMVRESLLSRYANQTIMSILDRLSLLDHDAKLEEFADRGDGKLAGRGGSRM